MFSDDLQLFLSSCRSPSFMHKLCGLKTAQCVHIDPIVNMLDNLVDSMQEGEEVCARLVSCLSSFSHFSRISLQHVVTGAHIATSCVA